MAVRILLNIAFTLSAQIKNMPLTSHPIPYPPELVPFKPVDGADTRYGQLYRPIGKCPFKEAGLKGFTLPAPFQVTNLFVDVGDFNDFRWPTLLELNDELDPFPGGMMMNAAIS